MRKNSNVIVVLIILVLSSGTLYAQDGNGPKKPFPIPDFGQIVYAGSSGETNNLVAEKLGSAMNQMRQHLCVRPDPVTSDWQNKFDQLLVDMVIGEYGVAWTQLRDFNPAERAIYDRFLAERQKIVRLLSDYSDKNPELKITIEEYEKARTNLLLASKNEYGRAVLTVHAELFYDRTFPDNIKLSPAKMRDLGIVEEYTAIRSKMIVLMAELHKRINERAVAEVRKLAPKDSMFPFTIHETPARLNQRILERLMKELQNLGVRFGTIENASPIYESAEWRTNAAVTATPFSQAEQDILRGDCKTEAKRWRSVRIVYRDTRLADANRVAELLRKSGFTVNQLWKVKDGDGWNGIFCTNATSTMTEAMEISELVKSVVKAAPQNQCESRADDPSGAHYVLWVNDR